MQNCGMPDEALPHPTNQEAKATDGTPLQDGRGGNTEPEPGENKHVPVPGLKKRIVARLPPVSATTTGMLMLCCKGAGKEAGVGACAAMGFQMQNGRANFHSANSVHAIGCADEEAADSGAGCQDIACNAAVLQVCWFQGPAYLVVTALPATAPVSSTCPSTLRL